MGEQLMAARRAVQVSITEISQVTGLTRETLVEIVEQGIVEPGGGQPDDWRFETESVAILKRAARLHKDLDIGWAGIALVLDLLDELNQARGEIRNLERRLGRFLGER